MSNEHAWKHVCTSEKAIAVDVQSYCINKNSYQQSAIDECIRNVSELILLGGPEQLSNNECLGRVLLLGIVSASENYYRNVVKGLLSLCPLSRIRAANERLSFYSATHYDQSNIGLGILENVLFSSSGDIKKILSKIIGIDYNKKELSSVNQALKQFECICQLRHAAVHSDGVLNSANLIALELASSARMKRININFDNLQLAAEVCLNSIRSVNRSMWEFIVQDWVANKILAGQWIVDKLLYTKVFRLFKSSSDDVGPSNAYQSYRSIKRVIIARLAGTS